MQFPVLLSDLVSQVGASHRVNLIAPFPLTEFSKKNCYEKKKKNCSAEFWWVHCAVRAPLWLARVISLALILHRSIENRLYTSIFSSSQDGHLSSQCEVRGTFESDQSISWWLGNLPSLAPCTGKLTYGSINNFCMRLLQKPTHYNI